MPKYDDAEPLIGSPYTGREGDLESENAQLRAQLDEAQALAKVGNLTCYEEILDDLAHARRQIEQLGLDSEAERHKRIEAEAKVEELLPSDRMVVGVEYGLYPGGVMCKLTYITDAGFETVERFCGATECDYLEHRYDRAEVACQAIKLCLEALK